MKPPEVVRREFVAQWLRKAGGDYNTAEMLLGKGDRFREIIAFHCQQAVEKYLKAVLVRHGVEFPKTHDLGKLLGWVATIEPALAESLRDAETLTPFGVEIRYPGDAPELPAGGEIAAFDIARRARDAVVERLEQYLAGE